MIYVLSDIHGNERRFDSVLEQIALQPEDILYILGDVIDRHGGGLRLLRRIMAMPNARLLLGNHEYMMLRALGHPRDDNWDDGNALEHWYRNGGQVTHDHFKRLRKDARREILEYLRKLPLNLDVEVGGRAYKLVHAAPVEEFDPEDRYLNPVFYAVWKRFGEDYTFSGDYTLIFGHTPTRYFQEAVPMEIWYGNRMIGIDCGSGYPESGPRSGCGRLSCLRLDDGAVFYSREKTPGKENSQ